LTGQVPGALHYDPWLVRHGARCPRHFSPSLGRRGGRTSGKQESEDEHDPTHADILTGSAPGNACQRPVGRNSDERSPKHRMGFLRILAVGACIPGARGRVRPAGRGVHASSLACTVGGDWRRASPTHGKEASTGPRDGLWRRAARPSIRRCWPGTISEWNRTAIPGWLPIGRLRHHSAQRPE